MTERPGRLRRMFKASMNTLMAPAPDPRLTFADTYGRQQVLLNSIRQAAVDLVAARARLERQVASLGERLPELAPRMVNVVWGPVPPEPAILLVETRTADVSSTDVRQRLASGRSLEGRVPAAVEDHAIRHGLYRA